MKKAVHFGAGKIGRGFIAELLHDSGYEIVFGDVVDALVDIVNKEHQYPLFLIDHNYEEKIIDHVIAYSNIKEPEKIIDAICDAEVITTSVMATNLPKIAPLLTQGLKKRLEQGKGKTTVMACENAIMGTDILKKAMIETGILTAEQIDEIAVYPNTAVDRMVFGGVHNGKEGIEIGDAFELAIERGKLIDPDSEPIKGSTSSTADTPSQDIMARLSRAMRSCRTRSVILIYFPTSAARCLSPHPLSRRSMDLRMRTS